MHDKTKPNESRPFRQAAYWISVYLYKLMTYTHVSEERKKKHLRGKGMSENGGLL